MRQEGRTSTAASPAKAKNTRKHTHPEIPFHPDAKFNSLLEHFSVRRNRGIPKSGGS